MRMKHVLASLLLALTSIAHAVPGHGQERSENSSSPAAFEQSIENAKAEMMATPAKALVHSETALRLAEGQAGKTGAVNRATALWLKAESLIGLNRLEEAGDAATEALTLVRKALPNSKLHGDLLRSRGAVRALSGDVQQALRDYQSAHRIFRRAGIARSEAIALQDLGQIYWEAGDYERTLQYYDQAVEIYNDDPGFALSNHNNLGETFKMLGRFSEAEREYDKALKAARQLGSPLLETRILSNLALVQVEQEKLAAASRTAGLALSKARSGGAAEWRPFVFGVQAEIAFAKGDLVSAGQLLDRAFAGADFATTDLLYREFHELGAEVFEKLGNSQKAFAHLRAFQRLDSQARDLVATASSQLLAAEFDFANQNLKISQLKQGQLERDIQIERERGEFRTLALVGIAVALLIILGLTLTAFFSIRRSRNEVRAANAELSVVNADLEHALKAKTDFLAMTSHEIRTPLNGILGTAQVLLAQSGLEEGLSRRIGMIQTAGQTMKALVDDLLDVAKMESGEVSVEMAPTAVEPLLKGAGQFWSDRIRAKGLEFVSEVEELPRVVQTDGDRLRQIVFNLLSNAAKFTREGTISLKASYDEDSSELTVGVADTGIGIPAAEQAKIFEAFHQVDNATTREFSGTGLGLSICRNLAAAIGGRIELESGEGEGSTFRLIVPASKCEGLEFSSGERPETLSECRLGLLEANQMKRAILEGLLSPHVRAVIPAADLDTIEQLVDGGLVDHVLLDAASVASGEADLPLLQEALERARSAEIETTLLLSANGSLPLDRVSRMAHSQLLVKPLAGDALVSALQDHYAPASRPLEERQDAANAA